ncbi:MAG: hypothetical protein J5964_07885 [Eubacterium sp.]|nr:hypothetical protein [Eubacterium sp.]
MKYLSRPLAILLSAIFILTAMPLTASASQDTWDPDNGVYDISTEADLLAFRDCLNNENDFSGKTVSLLNDLDFNGIDFLCPVETTMFSGNFDGKGHTISNINMVSADDSVVGLLPVLSGSVTVKDLTLSNVTIENGKDTTGVFCAYTYQCDVTFENCHLTGNSTIIANKSSFKYCSVFVPLSYFGNVYLDNCSVGENVSIIGTGNSDSAVASLVAFAYNTSESGVNIVDCINKADVTTNSGPIGGLVGQTTDEVVLYINRCANYGNVVSNQTNTTDPCGGLVGYANSSFIINSLNAGNVTSNKANSAGGIVGLLRINDNTRPYLGDIDTGIITYPEQHNLIYNCYNTGNVSTTSTLTIGGIVGIIEEHSTQAGNTVIKNVYNFGSVSAVSSDVCLGTIVGDTDAIIEDVYAQNETKAIQSLHKSDSTASPYKCEIGYYNTANKGGKVFPTDVVSGTAGPSGRVESVLETRSETPLDTDLKETLDKFVDEQNVELEVKDNSFRYLPWTYSDGSDGLDIHPVFGYDIINEAEESDKGENGGYLTTSRNGFEYCKFDTEESKTVSVTAVPEAGKSLKSITATDQNGNNVALTDKGNGVYTFEMPKADVTLNAQFEGKSAPKNSVYLTTKDSVDINFLIDADYYTSDPEAYVKLNYNHNPRTYQNDFKDEDVPLKSVEKTEDGRYKFTIKSAPAQLTEPIAITLYDSEGNKLYDANYSMWQYCKDIMDRYISIEQHTSTDMYDEETEEQFKKASELCKSLIDYATAAQVYFNYNKADMASKLVPQEETYYHDDVTNENYYHDVTSLTKEQIKANGAPRASISGSFPVSNTSLMSLSNTEVRFYYEEDINEDDYELSVSCESWYGSARPSAEFGEANSGKFISVGGIESTNLDNLFTLTINNKNTGEVTTIKYNATAYCYTVLRDTEAPQTQKENELRTLVKTIYLYNRYAEDYFTTVNG